MRMQLILNDLTIDTILRQLREVIGLSFFTYNGNKFLAGEVQPHQLKNSSHFIRGKKRPMILLSYNGSSTIPFYEGDKFIMDSSDKIIVKSEKEVTFSKVTRVTKKEEKKIRSEAATNKAYSDSYWKGYELAMEEELDVEWREFAENY